MGLSQSQLVTIRRPYLDPAIQDINDLCNRLDHNSEAERSLRERSRAFSDQWNQWNSYERWEIDRWENEGGATSDVPPTGFCAVDLPDAESPFDAVWHPWRNSAKVAATWLEQVGLNDECVGVRIELDKLPTLPLPLGFRDDLGKLNEPIRTAAEQVREILAAVLAQPVAKVTEKPTGKKPLLTAPLTKGKLGEYFTCHRNNVKEQVLDLYPHETFGKGRGEKYRMHVADMPPAYHQEIARLAEIAKLKS